MRPARFAWILLGLALARCTGDTPCDRLAAWRNFNTPACTTCKASLCADQNTAVRMAAAHCSAEFACVNRCPDRSALTCGCVDGCLVTPECIDAYRAQELCVLDSCERACREGLSPPDAAVPDAARPAQDAAGDL